MELESLSAMMTEDAQSVDEITRRWTRGREAIDAYLEQLRDTVSDVHSKARDLRAISWTDTGIVTFVLEQTYMLKGAQQTLTAPTSIVFRRIGEDWKVALIHTVPLADDRRLTFEGTLARMVPMERSEWVNEHRVPTQDDRTLLVLERGDPDGHPVLVHNGTPNSRLMFDHDVARARAQGIRLISYDRPGYGGSSPHPGRTVVDCTCDVRAIAAALDIDSLALWGISGGGPHALACAALLPDLVAAVAVLASIAPWEAPGLDYFDGMGQFNVDETLLAVRDPVGARAARDAAAGGARDGARGVTSLSEHAVGSGGRGGADRRARRVLRRVGARGPGARVRGLVGGQRRDGRAVGLRAWIDSHSRCCCFTAARTGSCRSRTASGSPRRSRG